jgi:hypothetical protein
LAAAVAVREGLVLKGEEVHDAVGRGRQESVGGEGESGDGRVVHTKEGAELAMLAVEQKN